MSTIDITPEWEKEFKRVSKNIIYFIELYYNKAHPDKAVKLTDEQKQRYFDKYRGVPLVQDFEKYLEYTERIKELKEKGYKDWEIL
ncbi:hypothetical protein [Capnocytophaga canis]|uniref:hypothetical protein n=1 Tax=Capnocytophaga canis TaxID=1848903 RepID=UPI0015621B50|nr:hypothetical protein [Capnocytophaga canis]